jgi:hypothetical protein
MTKVHQKALDTVILQHLMPLASPPLLAGSYEDEYSSVHQNVTVLRKKECITKLTAREVLSF